MSQSTKGKSTKKGPSKKRPTLKKKGSRPQRTKRKATKANDRQADLTATVGRERLQKVLARAGLGSRRALDERIGAGEIRVNGQTAEPGTTVGEGDMVELDGRRWQVTGSQPNHQTLIYFKPEGQVTTRKDPEGRPTVFDKLPRPKEGRWIAIGRLDINTSGLLLLTTDGELAHRMMHPSGNVDREYLCRIRGAVSDEQIEQLKEGVRLDDGMARFSDIVPGEVTAGHSWYTVAIMEGRNREVRRLWEAVGAQVARLKRVRFGPVFLPSSLRQGRFQELNATDHRILREDVGLSGRSAELELVSPGKAPGDR